MKAKYRHIFDRIVFRSRWTDKYTRGSDWTIIGIHQHWFGAGEYEYRFCFFGLEIHMWFIIKLGS